MCSTKPVCVSHSVQHKAGVTHTVYNTKPVCLTVYNTKPVLSHTVYNTKPLLLHIVYIKEIRIQQRRTIEGKSMYNRVITRTSIYNKLMVARKSLYTRQLTDDNKE